MDIIPVPTEERSPEKAQDAEFQVVLREYDALRRQVQTLMIFEVHTVNFAIVFSGIIVAALSQDKVMNFVYGNPHIILPATVIFPVLGMMNIYERFRLFCTVAYIDTYLRGKIILFAGKDVLLWQSYLKDFTSGFMAVFLSKIRSCVFIAPAIFLFSIFFYIKDTEYTLVDFSFLFVSIISTIIYFAIASCVSRSAAIKIAKRRVYRDLSL